MFLASSRSDPLEDFTPECLTSYGTDSVYGVLLFADERDPFEEDILLLRDVNVAFLAGLERGKRLLEVLLDLIAVLSGLVQGLGQSVDLRSLLLACFVASMNEGAPIGYHLHMLCVKLTLDRFIVLACPGAEGPQKLILLPVEKHLLHRAFLLVCITSVLQPGEKASTKLHLRHTAHIIRHNLLRQIFRLGNDGRTPRLA